MLVALTGPPALTCLWWRPFHWRGTRAARREAGGTSPPGAGPREEQQGLPSEPHVRSEDFSALGPCSQPENFGVSPPTTTSHRSLAGFYKTPAQPPLVHSVRTGSKPGPRTPKQGQDVAFPPASVCPAEARPSLSLSFLTCQMDITFARLSEATAGALKSRVLYKVFFPWGVGSPATAEGRGDRPPSSRASCSLGPGTSRGQERPPGVGKAVATVRRGELHSDSLPSLHIRFLGNNGRSHSYPKTFLLSL